MVDNVEIERVIFKEVSDLELDVINLIKTKRSIQAYFKRMRISAEIILVLFLMQAFGNVSYKYETWNFWKYRSQLLDEFLNMLLLMMAVFVIFNTVSYFWGFVKRQMVTFTENYYILLEAKVVSKYSGRKLAKEGKERKKNFITFECDQGICTTAIPISWEQYKNTAVGDNIVILKSVTVEGYQLKYLKEDEYRNIYNSRVKNS